MVLDIKLLGTKLKRYRKQFQESLSEVSKATGVSEQLLSDYENGKKEPSGDEILILADYYKCDYKFFISNEKLAAFEQTETLFRDFSGELSKDDRWSIQEFLFLCECEEYLMGLIPNHIRKPFSFLKQGTYYKGHGEQAASALRRHLGYKPNEVPMNVYDDFRKIGIHVFRRKLVNSNISGLFIMHPSAGKCVLVNYNEDIYRQRFTSCHEFAHAILDEGEEVIISFTKWSKGDLTEIRADTFASRYLMPPEFLKAIPQSKVWDRNEAIKWANKLKVNTEPLAIALKSAGIISDSVVEQIKSVKIPKHLKKDPELPDNLSRLLRHRKEELLKKGLSTFYVGLCFDAYDQGAISAGKLGEMLLASEQELKEIAQLYNRKLKYGD